jgi:hypothetical protein
MMIMDILKRKPLFDRESSTHLALWHKCVS